jgi:hypothetical protein
VTIVKNTQMHSPPVLLGSIAGSMDNIGFLTLAIGRGLGAACEAEFARWALALPLALPAGAFAISIAPSSEIPRKL